MGVPAAFELDLLWARPHAQLTVALAAGHTHAEVVKAAQRWFDAGFELSDALGRLALAQGVLEPDLPTELPDGTVYARIAIEPWRLSNQMRVQEQFLPRGRDRVMASFDELPEYVWLGIATMSGGIVGDPSIDITYRRHGTYGEWLQLDFVSSDAALADTDEGQAGLLRLLRDAAEVTGPSHGEISYQTSSMDQVALEFALARYPQETIPGSRWQLRSYGWVTIVGGDLVSRLGGIDVLRDSGAFVEVAQLRRGGVWLQATERWQDFTLATARPVFDVLAPVLPAGRPLADTLEYKNVLIDADPSDHRRSI